MPDLADPSAVRLCVNCRLKPIDQAWRPFCSERCKILDLARWSDGSYRVPGETVTEPLESEKEEGKS